MKKDPDQNLTDSVEIEALITRPERGQLRDEDAQLLARLLRLLLRLITLLQQKNASLSRLIHDLTQSPVRVYPDLPCRLFAFILAGDRKDACS